jgi:hypothetical protein
MGLSLPEIPGGMATAAGHRQPPGVDRPALAPVTHQIREANFALSMGSKWKVQAPSSGAI